MVPRGTLGRSGAAPARPRSWAVEGGRVDAVEAVASRAAFSKTTARELCERLKLSRETSNALFSRSGRLSRRSSCSTSILPLEAELSNGSPSTSGETVPTFSMSTLSSVSVRMCCEVRRRATIDSNQISRTSSAKTYACESQRQGRDRYGDGTHGVRSRVMLEDLDDQEETDVAAADGVTQPLPRLGAVLQVRSPVLRTQEVRLGRREAGRNCAHPYAVLDCDSSTPHPTFDGVLSVADPVSDCRTAARRADEDVRDEAEESGRDGRLEQLRAE